MLSQLPPLRFDLPWLALAALLVPLVVWRLRRVRRLRRSARLARYADPALLVRLLRGPVAPGTARTVRLMLVTALTGLALAGPRWGLARGPRSARGIDMAIAIDASLSMMAPDVRPSRLERVKQEVRRLRAQAPADRIALIAFAGRSYILTPLTTDDGAIELFLDNLDPSVVGQAGSSIASAVTQGTELLLASDGSADRALVLFSDGEAFESTEAIATASKEAGEKGIHVVTVGFGTTRGSTIPVRDGNTVSEKRDEDGRVVVTRYHPELLQQVATDAGGTFVAAEASDKASRIRAALRRLRTAERASSSREDHIPRFRWLLLPALLLLLYDSWRQLRGGGARSRAPGAATLAASATLLAGCTLPPDPAVRFAEGDVRGAVRAYREAMVAGDSSGLLRYNLGTALLGADSLPPAVEILEAVRRATDGEVRMRARYNAGLAQLLLGRTPENPDADAAYAAARAAYRALLTERPNDPEAQWNYELALRHPPPSGGGGGGGGGESPQQSSPPPQGNMDQRQAEALLNSAAREERDVQGRKQPKGKVPPKGKDW